MKKFNCHLSAAASLLVYGSNTWALSILPDVCVLIANAVSSATDVFYPGHVNYVKDTYHWMSSSSDFSLCSVEPGTAQDVGTILRILGTSRTQFAVKGGGHASNPGFSSTPGVQIAMSRFSEVTYHQSSQTATIGAGLIWDDVYAGLAPYNVNVVGGRVSGVGVAGFTLGGGYSWKSNQHGLTVDTITAFELVKPDGTVVNVTHDSDSQLFFGLKGGLNNFGIVTRFTLKVFPQTQVWGGLITYTFPQVPDVSAATVRFANEVTDPKASIITTYNFVLGELGISELIFYDGPTPPPGIFDDFLNIKPFTKDVKTRDFVDLVRAFPANVTSNTRGIFQSAPIQSWTTSVVDAIVNDAVHWGAALTLEAGVFISYQVEPFLPQTFTKNAYPSAYPPDSARNQAYLPLNIYYAWATSLFDSSFQDAIRTSADRIAQFASQNGQPGALTGAIYPNYAIFDTPVERMYGENVAALKSLKARVDPSNVMGLAGGFKI